MRTTLRRGTHRRGWPLLAGVALAVTGLTPTLAAPAASAAPAATAAPNPSTSDVHVYPSPGTSTISPTQQISFRGVSGSSLPTLQVTGSASGAHAGRWVVQSDGGGATWEPSSRFRAGEKVTVTTSASVAGTTGHSFAYTVSRPAAISAQQLGAIANDAKAPAAPKTATAKTATAKTATPKVSTTPVAPIVDSTSLAAPTSPPPPFLTRPDLQPPAIATKISGGGPAPGVLLSTPLSIASTGLPAGTASGAQISDNNGNLVWFNPVNNGALDLQTITYMGQPALAYHAGQTCVSCTTTGYWVVLDNHYNQIAIIQIANGYQADGHALEISPDGTKALLEAYNPIVVNDSANGGPSNLSVLEGVIQEIDLKTGVMDFEWHSTDANGNGPVPVPDSYFPPVAGSTLDYIHINSLHYVDNKTILFSARHTSTVYKMDLPSGNIEWRLGGKDTRNQFTLTDGDGGPSYAHDVQLVAPGIAPHSVNQISVFDNGVGRNPPYSRGVVFNLDETHLNATVAKQWVHSPNLFGLIVGSNRLQPNNDQLISFGNTGYADEFDSSGNVVWASQTEVSNAGGPPPNQVFSYRTLRADWHATPPTSPAIATSSAGTTTTVTASWNGATDVASWQLLGGTSVNSLQTVGAPVSKMNFETSITDSTSTDKVFEMEALDSTGKIMGTSPPSNDPIQVHYQSLGGQQSFLGTATGPEQAVGSGMMESFQGGNIYWSQATGASSVHGAILGHYLALNGPTGVLGFPTSDEQAAGVVGPSGAAGRFNTFQVGNIYWSPATGAQEVQGLILAHYTNLGGPSGFLGFPTSDEQVTGPSGSGGRFNTFQGANIYWSPGTGAQEVQGLILAHYVALNGAAGFLGFPTSDEQAAGPSGSGGRFNSFQGGNIYWSQPTGAQEVQGLILAHYTNLNGPAGVLGFPTSDERAVPGGRFNSFQVGNIYWSPPSGAFEVQGAILGHYLSLNGPAGVLGFPTSDEQAAGTLGSGGRANTFQGGNIYWSAPTGAFEVHGAILAQYKTSGGPTSTLGFPTSDEFAPTPTTRQSNFQSGHYISFDFTTGTTTVH